MVIPPQQSLSLTEPFQRGKTKAMRSKSDYLRVEIKETNEGDLRTFLITLNAPANHFQLADLLTQRKVIAPVNRQLKLTVKGAIERYLSDAESMVSALASTPKQSVKHRTGEHGTCGVTLIPVRSLKYPRSNE